MKDTLKDLKRQLAALAPSPAAGGRSFALGAGDIDDLLGGGLPRACLHEVFAREAGDEASSAGFALALALRAAGSGRKIAWVRHQLAGLEAGQAYGPGLKEFGLDPDDVVFVAGRNDRAVLRAGLEAVRCSALGAVLIELWGKSALLDLTASRRMMLAASRSGVTGLLLRHACEPQPSSALTRWRVGAAPSLGLAADAPSHPVFDITLERHRAGIPPRRWRVEWNRDHQRFVIPAALPAAAPISLPAGGNAAPGAEAPVFGAVVSVSFDGQAAPARAHGKARRTG